MRERSISSFLGLALCVLLWTPASEAMRFQERPTWMVGIGWGFGRGVFENSTTGENLYKGGSAPQIHFGWKPSSPFLLGVHYEAWMLEFGNPPTKYRRSLQNLSAGLTWYPGNPEDASGGIYLRAGGGLGWAGTATVPVEEEEAQTHGDRVDEWGVALFGDAGYEFWISGNATLGAGLSFDYLDIGEQIVGTGFFGAVLLDFNIYF